MKFADTIGPKIVHIHMGRVMSLLDSFKEEKATLEPILDKWTAREVDLKTIYSLSQGEEGVDVIIRPTCDLENELSGFAVEGVNIERRENLYRKEYASEKNELFLGGFLSANKIKDKEVWIEELGHKLCQRINNIINMDDTSLFIQTIEEIEKIKSHFGFLEKEVKQLTKSWKSWNKLKKKIIKFSWLDDDTFKIWETKYILKETEAEEGPTDAPTCGSSQAT